MFSYPGSLIQADIAFAQQCGPGDNGGNPGIGGGNAGNSEAGDNDSSDSDTGSNDSAGDGSDGNSEAGDNDSSDSDTGSNDSANGDTGGSETADSEIGGNEGADDAESGAEQAANGAGAEYYDNSGTSTAVNPLPARTRRPLVRSAHGPYEREEVLAVTSERDAIARIRGLGFSVIRSVNLTSLRLRLTRLRVPFGWDANSALRLLRQSGPTGLYDLNHIYRTVSSPCQTAHCYGFNLIGWNSGIENCAADVKIGMLDTAIDTANPALSGQKLITQAIGNPGSQLNQHGTAIAALLIGKASTDFSGLLPRARLYAADVFIADDAGQLYTNAFLMTSGLDWLQQENVSLINISIAGPNNSVLQAAVHRVIEQGKIIIAAAGNGGPQAEPAYPAAFPGAIAVTAVDWRLRPYRQANQGAYLTLSAPGVGIWTPLSDGGHYNQGTSFAAPFVTAVAASLLSRTPAMNATQLTELLSRNARDLGLPGKDDLYGWGLVQSASGCDS